MEDCRGGLARKGETSPDIGWLSARREGLAPGWREELRRGEPTWPNAELETPFVSSSRFCLAKRAPKREGLADPTLLADSAGVPSPLRLSRKMLESCSVLESRRIFSCGVRRS